MEHGDFVRAECDLWKVAYLIVSSTGVQGSIPVEEHTRADQADIEKWAKGAKHIDLAKKAESLQDARNTSYYKGFNQTVTRKRSQPT